MLLTSFLYLCLLHFTMIQITLKITQPLNENVTCSIIVIVGDLFLYGRHHNNKKYCTTHMPPDLDLWRSDPKINRGHLLVMTNQHVKYEDFVIYIVFKIISGNHFNIQGHCDLDLWPSDPKINRGHLLVMTNLHVTYEDFVMYSIQDNQWKPF